MARIISALLIAVSFLGCSTASNKSLTFNRLPNRTVDNVTVSNWDLFMAKLGHVPVVKLGTPRSTILNKLKKSGRIEKDTEDELLVRGAGNGRIGGLKFKEDNPKLFGYKFKDGLLVSGPNIVDENASDEPQWIVDSENGCRVLNLYPQPDLNESITWTGSCKDGYAHGDGKLTWYETGIKTTVYVGNLSKGIRDGQGEHFGSKGDRYIGEWKNDKYDGQGTLIENSGQVYKGGWKNGETHGFGRWTWPDGTYYEGNWLSPGLWEGDITIGRKNGESYVGTLKNYRPWEGIFTNVEGQKLVFKKGEQINLETVAQ